MLGQDMTLPKWLPKGLPQFRTVPENERVKSGHSLHGQPED